METTAEKLNEEVTQSDEAQTELTENSEETTSDQEAPAQSAESLDTEQESQEEQENLIVSIGDSPSSSENETKAPEWVRDLRKAHRDIQKENKELKQKLQAQSSEAQPSLQLGAKPRLENFDYDADVFEQELSKWYEQKRAIDKHQADIKAQEELQKQAWQQQLNAYEQKKSALKVKNFEDAESNVLSSFSDTQQAIVVQGAEDPALTIYALGMNDAKLKELANIKDPVKFSFAVAKLETQLKVRNRKAPQPERTVSGTAPKSGAVDSELDRLREEAARTGDYSKIHRYKRLKKSKK